MICEAQVWTLPSHVIYINISYSSGMYDEKFDSTGDIKSLPVSVNDHTVSLLAQYGLTEKLTAELRIPYKFMSTYADVLFPDAGLYETGSLNTIGNVEAGALYKLIDDKPFLTFSFFVEANSSDRNYLNGLQSGFNSWGFKPGLGVGWAFTSSWLTFYTGGDIRTNHYSSSILSTLEIGYKPANYVYLAGVIYMRQSLNNGGDCDCTTQQTALYLNNQEYVAPGVKSGFTFGSWGFNVGYNFGLSGANIAYSNYVTAGLQFKSK